MKCKNLIITVVISITFLSVTVYGQDKAKTIDKCIEVAFKNNPELKYQELKIKETESKYHQQTGNLLPHLDLGLSYNRYEKLLPSKKSIIGDSLDDYYGEVSLRQILFSKYTSMIDSARVLLQSEKNKLEYLRRRTVFSVKKAYYDLLKNIHILKIQTELLNKLKEQLQIARLLYNSGKITNLDVLKIETQVAISEDTVDNLRNLAHIKSLQLAQAIGIKEEVSIEESIPETKENIGIRLHCVENNFKNNPELSYIESLKEKARYDIKEVNSGLFPSVFLRANYSIENSRLFPSGSSWSNWYAGIGISYPLFDGGNNLSEINQAESRYAQISETYRQIEINISVRFESARSVLTDSASRLKTTKKVLDFAKETLTAAELRYNSGKLTALELIDTQIIWNNAQINYINNVIDYIIAVAEIESICLDAIVKEAGK